MKALSIRQPWAWLIVHGWKDIENREWPTRFRGRCWVHASATMTRADYEACAIYVAGLELPKPVELPLASELTRGGIVGAMEIVDCVTASESPWFCGTYGFVLRGGQPAAFRYVKGKLGFFEVSDVTEANEGKQIC